MYQFINNVKVIRISLEQTKRYCGSKSKSTYYEILGVPKDASKKDIREAFIKLSKLSHPDKSNETSAKSHNDFIKISEAYNVLIKDSSRQQYDINLRYEAQSPPGSGYRAYNSQNDDTFGYNRSRVYYNDKAFYEHIKNARMRAQRQGPDKNFTPPRILLYCFIWALIGLILQVWAIMRSPVFNRVAMDEKSEKNFNEYRRIRENVINNNRKSLDEFFMEDQFDGNKNSDFVKEEEEEKINW